MSDNNNDSIVNDEISTNSNESEDFPICGALDCLNVLEERWFTPCCYEPLCEFHQKMFMLDQACCRSCYRSSNNE